jgi:hypothetical protein
MAQISYLPSGPAPARVIQCCSPLLGRACGVRQPLRCCFLGILLGVVATLGTSLAGAQSEESVIRALIAWVNQGPAEAPTAENRNRVVVTTEGLAHGAVTALGMDVNGNLPARALVFNEYTGNSEFVFQRAFHVGQYQGETTVILSYRTLSDMSLYRLSPGGVVRNAWHAELSDAHNVTSERNLDQAEAESGVHTELDFWRRQLRDRKAPVPQK